MILFKDGIKRTLEDKDTIEIFKDAGWIEYPDIRVKNEPIKEDKKEEPVKVTNKKTTKKTTKKK